MTREPSTAADFDAAESYDARESTLNARTVAAHEHYYLSTGECWCGDRITQDEAS